MVYGVKIDKGERFYTYLKKLFNSLDNIQTEYKWLISNHECYPHNTEIQKLFNRDHIILSGKELTSLVNTEDFQWVWGILSAFDPSVSDEDILKYSLYSFIEDDAYNAFYNFSGTMQHPLSKIGIAAFDSSCMIVLSKDMDLLDTLKKSYPFAKALELKNE